jgi:hypothetical protein
MPPSTLLPSPLQEQLARIARKIFWWGTPEEALENTDRFLAQVMVYGDWDDVSETLSMFGEDAFRNVLREPPSGVFDLKSWTYWHHRLGVAPLPPLPSRFR